MFRYRSPASVRHTGGLGASRGPQAVLLLPLGLALALALGGCDGDSGDAAGAGQRKAAAGPSVIAPGKPGESARTLSPQAARKSEDDRPNAADLRYVAMMITHHGQALTLTALAPSRASAKSVKRLAARIADTQGPEIEAMKGWQSTHSAGRKTPAHEHEAMPGMASPEQIEDLKAAQGADFDALFLKLMIAHHEGAVTMATDVLSEGNNVLVEEMANDVVSQQSSEIHRMRGLAD